MDVEPEVVALERGAVDIRHLAHLIADNTGRIVERRRSSETFALIKVASEQCNNRLGQ